MENEERKTAEEALDDILSERLAHPKAAMYVDIDRLRSDVSQAMEQARAEEREACIDAIDVLVQEDSPGEYNQGIFDAMDAIRQRSEKE